MTTTAPCIAIVDDEASVRASIEALLKDSGFNTVAVAGGDELREHDAVSIDLYLIDLKLAGESGLDVARDIHRRSDVPVMMLSGVGDEIDRVIGLEAGADDYLSKPFNPRELIARVRAILRRTRRSEAEPVEIDAADAISFGDFRLETLARRLMRRDGTEVVLSNAEYRLLDYLVRHAGRVVDRSELVEHLGGDLSRYVDRTIDVMMLRLRGKIEVNRSKPVHLQTRRGKGYVFVLGDTGEMK